MNSDQPGPVVAAVRACASSHRALEDHVADLSDDQARRPSLLPDWTVGHVLTHLARNAEGFARMVEGADAGDAAAMYPRGREGRAADIEAGASRPAGAIVADLRAMQQRLDDLFEQCSDVGWNGRGLMVTGEIPIRDLPMRRRGEVEIHRVDMGLGYTFADCPADFVRSEVIRLTGLWASVQPMGLAELPAAALALPPHDRLAWLAGRAEVEGLRPAGVT